MAASSGDIKKVEAAVKKVFVKFIHFGRDRASKGSHDLRQKSFEERASEEMDGPTFAKLCRDTGILEPSKVTPIDIDIIFAKVVTKHMRKITFSQFLEALQILAEKRGQTVGELIVFITKARGPRSSGTRSSFNIPDNVGEASLRRLDRRKTLQDIEEKEMEQKLDVVKSEKIKEIFWSFCTGSAKGQMDGMHFAKLCKDCGLTGKSFKRPDIDLIFTKSKRSSSSGRSIGFHQFKTEVLPKLACKTGMTQDEIADKIIGAGGPTFVGTKAHDITFSDGTSTADGSVTSPDVPRARTSLRRSKK